MAVMELWRRRDLEGTVKPEYIDGNFFTQDSVGNLVGVKCYKDGAEVALTGSVTGYCVLPSGETVSVAGTRSGNQASILVPQSALAYTGPLGITLKLIDGNTITTLMRIIVVVYRSKTDTVITPSSQIITDWANQISAALQEVEDASAAQDVKIADLKSALNNTNESLLNENLIPVNIGIVKPHISQISSAASKGVTVTITGTNKFTMNGTATANFSLAFDYNAGAGTPLVSIEHNPVYFIIKRSDNVHNSNDIALIPSYFNNSDSPVSTTDKITEFNNIVKYTYPSAAKKFRTYLNVYSGASFNNVEFEYVALYANPLSELIMPGMATDNYTNIPLSFERKTGYYASNGTFSTYSNIWGAEVSVDNTKKYHLNYRSFYGMSETVFFDSSDNFLSATTSHGDDANYSKDFYIPDGASKMLVQAYGLTEQAVLGRYSLSYLNGKRLNGATLDVYEIPYKETSVGHALDLAIGSESVSPLFGKKVAYDGDSICESRLTGTAANGGAFAKLIADKTGCTYVNNAVSGGILASAVPSGTMPHSVVNSLGSLPNDADIYCIEGGVNDFWRDVPLGDYSQTDYNASVNTATVCGALEHIIRAITYYHVGKPLVFVLVHKATATINANNAGYTFDEMREKMIGILNKYAIPYYDAYLYSGLNGYNSIQSTTFLTANSTGQGDGIHPNEAGYRRYYVPQLIDLFESLMPVLE